jgi:hypothetical protein
MPRSSTPLISTMRVDGRPSAPTVASVIALGSGSCAFQRLLNQRRNCCSGSASEACSSSASRS